MMKLTPITFDKFLDKINPLKATIEIDLSEVSFISPAVLTQLCGLCYDLHFNENKKIIVKLNKDIGHYLVRAGFVKNIKPVAKVEPEEFEQSAHSERLYGSNPLLIEVTKIEDYALLSALLDRIVVVLRTKLQYPKYEALDIVTAISEICQNILDHKEDVCGFIAMQVYNVGKKSFLQIGISDYGVGLWGTLNRNIKNPLLKSHLEAINFATKAGTSEHDSPVRGTGLYHLLRIMKEHSGIVQIHSGYGKVRYNVDKKTEWGSHIPYLPGVQVVLELNAKETDHTGNRY
jgi:anti-sigma regulatory factor (Ser/Thr protein kinase)/anti-anti-sigma regulatory factor